MEGHMLSSLSITVQCNWLSTALVLGNAADVFFYQPELHPILQLPLQPKTVTQINETGFLSAAGLEEASW